jgi:glycosyltransferase involved in cell wall biosynthesis
MTKTPRVSILTPAYNASAFLSEAVASALAQTCSDFEMLIVDDGSTDDTLQLARTWERADPRIRAFTRVNGGIAAARNTAIAQSRGEYFALLDSDDIWHPKFLESQMRIFDARRDVDVVTGNAYNLGGVMDGRPVNPDGTACRELSLLDILEREDSVFIMSIFRRAVIDRIGWFDERLRANEDYDLWIRAAHAGFVFLHNPLPLGLYRRRPDSVSANEIQMFIGIMGVLKQARELCADRPREMAAIRKQLARFEQERLFASAKAHLVQRNFADAASDFNRLFDVRRDFTSAAIARISRTMPGMLLWAYRMKCRLNGRVRANMAASRPPSTTRPAWHTVGVHHDHSA